MYFNVKALKKQLFKKAVEKQTNVMIEVKFN